MRHICSWCKNEIAPPDGAADDHLVTHGICEGCKRGVLAEVEDIKRKKMSIESAKGLWWTGGNGNRRDEHRTSNVQHRTSNKKTRDKGDIK